MPSKIYADTFGNSNETDAITIDSSGNTTLSGTANNIGAVTAGTIDGVTIGGNIPASATFTNINGGQLAGMRNLIINGAMQIDQRNSGSSGTVGTTTNDYTVDRFHVYCASGFGSGTNTFEQVEDAPTGFYHSLQVTSTSSDTPTGTENAAIGQNIEGLNIQHLGWGTSDAKSITLSFYAKSSLPGTYSVSIRNSDNSRCYVTDVTVPSSWGTSPITVVIPGDTGGTWLSSNLIGIRVSIALAVGPDRQTSTLDTWQTTLYNGSTSCSNLFSGSYTFNLTGVQLEVGSTATAFEHRPYGTELALCQRYYQRASYTPTHYSIAVFTVWSGVENYGTFPFSVEMRANPTFSYSAVSDFIALHAGTVYSITTLNGNTRTQNAELYFSSSTSFGNGESCWLRFQTATAYISFDSDL